MTSSSFDAGALRKIYRDGVTNKLPDNSICWKIIAAPDSCTVCLESQDAELEMVILRYANVRYWHPGILLVAKDFLPSTRFGRRYDLVVCMG
jgi:hypothetical protein